MQMTVEDISQGTVIVVLTGALDAAGAAAVEERLAGLADTATRLVVDLSGVGFMASIGMRSLLATAKALQRRAGRLVLLAPQPMVAEALRTAGISTLIPTVATRQEALAG